MKIRSRLKHGASGLLARFISRNNDYQGFWTLGVLYSSLRVAPWRVEFNLISEDAYPSNEIAAGIATEQSAFLRAALSKQHVAWDFVKRATLTVQFNADVRVDCIGTIGEPFICTVELESVAGHSVTFSRVGRCAAWKPGLFSGRAGYLFPQL
ncbi:MULTISPECIES: hypothetical protein [unclassified Duganella]|jgi:hypothetical protein|uniref:hypothetical protein n=1 Tax=unclassified Duganella TaxID=2636909 RepID=UPI001113B9EA|nr:MULTISPECIES: hypothetical protein [unclassified Duganella]